jgi:hypothetical protein
MRAVISSMFIIQYVSVILTPPDGVNAGRSARAGRSRARLAEPAQCSQLAPFTYLAVHPIINPPASRAGAHQSVHGFWKNGTSDAGAVHYGPSPRARNLQNPGPIGARLAAPVRTKASAEFAKPSQVGAWAIDTATPRGAGVGENLVGFVRASRGAGPGVCLGARELDGDIPGISNNIPEWSAHQPVWRNWQTRWIQNPLSFTGRVGSTPSTGTSQAPFNAGLAAFRSRADRRCSTRSGGVRAAR